MTKNLKLRNIPLILMAVFMISAMVYSATEIRASYAQPPAPVFMEPPQVILTDAVAETTTFNVNVTIANVTNVGGIQFRLEWNTSLLNCTGINEVFFHALTPEASWPNIWSLKLTYNNTAGYADYAQTLQDTLGAIDAGYCPFNATTENFPPEGKLALATFTFKVLIVPPSAATYYDSVLLLSGVKVGTPITADEIPVTVSSGYYRVYGPPETTNTTITYVGVDYTVTTVTNASLVPGSMEFAKLNNTSYKLDFNLTGAENTTAYVNVTIPKMLMSIGPSPDQWVVQVDGLNVTPTVTSDATNWYIYVTPTLGTTPNNVEIFGTTRVYGPPETTNTTITYLGTNYTVTTVTNASLVPGSMEFANLSDTSYRLDFNLTGEEGTTAYVNVTIPNTLMSIGPSPDQWVVKVNGLNVTPTVTPDAANWYIYVTTTLGTTANSVEIFGTIPEFTWLFIPLLMAATLVAVGLRRRKPA